MASKASKNLKLIDSRVTNKRTLTAFSNRVLWLVTRHTYEYVSEETHRSPAWFSHAVSRRWHMIKPTPLDIARIELFYRIENKRNRKLDEKDKELKQAMRLLSEAEKMLRKYIRQYKRKPTKRGNR